MLSKCILFLIFCNYILLKKYNPLFLYTKRLISQENKIMSGFVYLMKNGDLYKLGCTTNLKSEASKMKPGDIISSFKTNDPKSFEVLLLRLIRKKEFRIQTIFVYLNQKLIIVKNI